MNEPKFTKAPWFAVDYAGSFCIQNGPMYEDKDVLSYDSMCGKEYSYPKDVVEANAKLIAAAPEMYNALKELIDRTEELATIVHIITPDQGLAIVKAKDAIKKATK